ncbi:TRAP transporter large permease subunit [Rhodococcus sp. F64268]|uniref:TRAP transporter large permease subunit n=1 Tax=Rhodococcus sp. F64268 TaxID=2926402 RepID=UPI001FF460D4|nr:TRAP transporter large permease subunit [Rhodococcus sp. F64268]MCK0091672.1 TRAP transporter large permease subunit [Rhodococcus sp. F64268]
MPWFASQIAIIALTVPIMGPVVEALGYSPVWFGIFVVLLAEIGLVTPPLGLNVLVASKSANRPVGEDFWGGVSVCGGSVGVRCDLPDVAGHRDVGSGITLSRRRVLMPIADASP